MNSCSHQAWKRLPCKLVTTKLRCLKTRKTIMCTHMRERERESTSSLHQHNHKFSFDSCRWKIIYLFITWILGVLPSTCNTFLEWERGFNRRPNWRWFYIKWMFIKCRVVVFNAVCSYILKGCNASWMIDPCILEVELTLHTYSSILKDT